MNYGLAIKEIFFNHYTKWDKSLPPSDELGQGREELGKGIIWGPLGINAESEVYEISCGCL